MNETKSEALKIAASLAKPFEGLHLAPYFCPAGVPTQGYGTVWKPEGTRVSMSDPEISEATAEEWLKYGLMSALEGALRASPNLINHPRKLGAVTDFIFNLGVTRYRASTFRKKVASEDWEEAVIELKKWRKAGGKVLRGLVRRRAAEAVYFDIT